MNTTKLAITALLSAFLGVALTLSVIAPSARAQQPAPKGAYRVASAESAGAAEAALNRMESDGYVFVGSATHASSPAAFLIFKGK